MAEVLNDALSRREAQIEEYSQYVAPPGGIRNATGAMLYGPGFPIPAGNVEADGAVILLRHGCPGVDPETGQKCTIEHNAVLERTEPGIAIKVKKAAKSGEAK